MGIKSRRKSIRDRGDIKKLSPKAGGIPEGDPGGYGVQSHGRGEASSSNADAGDLPDVRRESDIIRPFAAAQEMIHTYSLVHDDLPAMDNDKFRRGRRTTHVVYGEDMGILAGDALLNYAFETAATAFEMEPESAPVIGKAIAILAGKAGVYGMIGGQVVDVSSSGRQIEREKLDFIYALKTGALIESSMMIGAVLAGASKDEIRTIERIASKVGLAFQIQDDILDVTSTTDELGKPVHSDEKNEKTTYVTLRGLEQAKRDVEVISEEALTLLEGLPVANPFLTRLLRELIHRKK